MKSKSALVGGVVLAMCSALLFRPAQAQSSLVEINVATAYPAENFHTQNLQQYANDVARVTNGQVRLKIHPGGALIKPAEIFGSVRRGAAEAGEVIMSSLSRENALFAMDALPFIVSGYDDARRMWDASRGVIGRMLNERGLQLLYAVPWPPQNLYARVPINSLLDFRGLRMRTYNPATERIAELVGARPVTVQVVDLAKAIANEELDLMLTSSQTGTETKAWSKMPHYYKVSAWIPKNVVFINKKVFDQLDGGTRERLVEAARMAEERGWKMSQNSDQSFESQLAANRMQISNMDPYIRRYLDRIGENLAREWLKQAGDEELKVLLKYTTDRSMGEAARQ